jgi:hypothetical protein
MLIQKSKSVQKIEENKFTLRNVTVFKNTYTNEVIRIEEEKDPDTYVMCKESDSWDHKIEFCDIDGSQSFLFLKRSE